MVKSKVYEFIYKMRFEKASNKRLKLLSYNSPDKNYIFEKDDLDLAVFEDRVVDIKKLRKDIIYYLEMKMILTLNSDEKTYDQIFEFIRLEEVK